ncbi:family 20 glycosylhydrolase [Ohtaekwangia sp.]|uniref:family 20 glycosylhydrolase n=1 Tax=Ohtaekwangia sp. TaxID=2066019 RepID=UPI002FDF0954
MNTRIIVSSLLLLLVIGACSSHRGNQQVNNSPRFPIIPYPQQLKAQQGTFHINTETRIVRTTIFSHEAEMLRLLLAPVTGTSLAVTETEVPNNFIALVQDATLTHPEGYTLEITPHHVIIKARSGAGAFRAIETIRQLLPADIEARAAGSRVEAVLPATHITDYPAYNWRGMHLDVSRHFFSTDYLKKFIDLLALYKFNTLHLHLTDDQGWRIEIKKYPKLTEAGAWRELNNQDSSCIKKSAENPDFVIDPKHIIQRDGKTLYGGFYTQDEMREIIAFASDRHITIIPEIDMPGHMMAAIREYPFLSCTGEAAWGKLFSTPICPCNEETYRFAEDIFTEIFALFPSPYVHLGADEVEKTSWGKADACQTLMQKNNLKDLHELQSYFVRRMEKFFQAHGKKLIGWDEILEGGISPSAMVMYWRSWVPDAPVKAAKNGNLVIMTPGNPLYFDAQPDEHSLPNVYHFDPVPKGLDSVSARNIIGAQANTWTEYIPTEERADYMIMPRMTALSEVLWTHRQDYTSYLQRLASHYDRLDRLNVNYRLPELEGFTQKNAFVDRAILDVKPPLAGFTLRYTTDGSLPDHHSTELKAPLTIDQPLTIRLAAFTKAGRRGDVYKLEYDKQTYSPAESSATLQPGLTLTYYKGFFKNVASIKSTADTTLQVPAVVVPEKLGKGSFGLKYRGYIDVPEQGIYNFYFTCDDGGVLYIDDRLVVDNDGLHAPLQKSGGIALSKGAHRFEIDFIEGGGGYTLELMYSTNGSKPAPVPAGWWRK